MSVPYKLYQVDCLEFMKSLSDKSVDCVITDPPYIQSIKILSMKMMLDFIRFST